MDSTTCTAAAVTPYPKHVPQAHSSACSRPKTIRRPTRHAPQPPSLAPSCLSRASPAARLPFTTQTLVKRSRTLTNARKRSPISRPCRPASASRKSDNPPNPGSVQTFSRKLSSNAHERSHNPHEHTPMSASPHHSPSSESRQLQCRQSHPNSRQTLTDAHEHSQTLTPASNCPSRSFPQFPLTLLQLSASMAGPVAAERTDPNPHNDL